MRLEKEEEKNALRRALRYIGYKPRTRKETEDRMMRYGHEPVLVERVLYFLEKEGLIDDLRYGRQLLYEKVDQGDLSARAVRNSLVKKGVPGNLIDEVLEEYPWDREKERAEDVAIKKISKVRSEDPEKRRKQTVDYLLRRGFNRDIAESAWRHIERKENRRNDGGEEREPGHTGRNVG